jgi:hypothetical protein
MFAGDVTMWILDTDHVSFILGGDQRVNNRHQNGPNHRHELAG